MKQRITQLMTLGLVVGMAACDTDVVNPGPISADFLNDPAAQAAIANGAGRAAAQPGRGDESLARVEADGAHRHPGPLGELVDGEEIPVVGGRAHRGAVDGGGHGEQVTGRPLDMTVLV